MAGAATRHHDPALRRREQHVIVLDCGHTALYVFPSADAFCHRCDAWRSATSVPMVASGNDKEV